MPHHVRRKEVTELLRRLQITAVVTVLRRVLTVDTELLRRRGFLNTAVVTVVLRLVQEDTVVILLRDLMEVRLLLWFRQVLLRGRIRT